MNIPPLSRMEVADPNLAELELVYGALISRVKAASTADEAISALSSWNELRVEIETWRSLVEVRFNQHTDNAEYKKRREFCDEITPKLIEWQVAIKRLLLDGPFAGDIEQKYGPQVIALWRSDLATFEPAIADDLVTEARLVGEFTELTGTARFPFREETLNLSSVRKYQTSSDRDTRHDVAAAMWGWFDANVTRLDALYDELVRVRTGMARKLGYPNYIKLGYARMGRVDYEQQDVERWRAQVRDVVVPLAARIRAAQASSLGLASLNLWDEGIFDPRGNPAPRGDRAWMVERATEMFDAMHPELAGLFREMNRLELLDLDTRDGKAPGGFCTGLPKWGMPFIFANFTGTMHDSHVFTHEMGHAFQAWKSRDLPLVDYHWPTSDGAEIHSISLEFLCMPYIEKFFGDDAGRFDRVHLMESLLFMPYGVAVDHFQHLIYENPDATPAERHAMWRQLEQTYLPWRDHGDLPHTPRGGFWQTQRHIYLAPFYYIDYTLAQACALQFWVKSRENYGRALEDYVALCGRGGSLPFQSLARSAGLISPFDAGCLDAVARAAADALGVSA